MYMSDDEILASYQQAKSQAAQVGILADLNGTDKKAMAAKLVSLGLTIPSQSAKRPRTFTFDAARALDGLIDNPTEEEIYPSVEVYTTGQHVTLTNLRTGRAVTIEHSIGATQKLVVDLRDVSAYLWTQGAGGDYGEKEDVSHWMSLDSEPWGLLPGQNTVAIANEVPEDTPLAFIRWRVPCLGV